MIILTNSGLRVAISFILFATLFFACNLRRAEVSDHSPTAVIVSYNIRYDNPGDGADAWPNRRDRVAGLIRFHGADVAGLQEAQRNQIDDLVERLPEYGWYGVGRDDGATDGEFVPIFYRQERFSAEETGTFWLSPMPEGPGPPAWDAAITRIVSWVRLTDNHTGGTFFVFNAHFDHVGELARGESAKLLRDRVALIAARHPAVVLGDLNAEPDSDVYAILMAEEGDGYRLVDAAALASTVYGPVETFHGFAVSELPGRRIDYIFLSEGFEALRYGVLSDQHRGHYPSDHLPVLAEVAMP